ncbi:DUF3320 domain-containing protein [Salinicola peritrichatus]|uniref:DUF3320 domain-containing protein n=1 Tax=Salinicola peritrichatus TaxID=1267424 RepID=UPI000DA13FB3|nr:DUF3320 domain-containing protein [Salinicola peritrichatus]
MSPSSQVTSLSEPRAIIEIEFHTVAKVNFSSSQNGISILKKLAVQNVGDKPLENLTVEVTCTPGLIRQKTWQIDRLAVGDQQTLPQLETSLDHALLAGLNEAEVGNLELTVKAGGVMLHEEVRPIELLARDEWGGVGEMAHLLAAYISPNESVIATLLKEAGRLLEATGKSGAIDGYQANDPARVWMVAGAIWSALTGMGLTYAVPPASFEMRGQKIRSPERIRAEGLATCLDSALLLAGCYEAAGLNPVVMFSEGHAWAGVWLVDRDFGSITEPDVMSVRKAVDARELVLLETTALTRRPSVGFEQAAAEGKEHTAEPNEHAFLMAVDVRRARAARIRPLANHRILESVDESETPAVPAALPKPLDFGFLPGDLIEETPDTAAGRIARWQRKLLDLSLRNRLLNFKDTKQTLPLLCPDVSSLEDRLAEGEKFKVLPLADEDPAGRRDLSANERAAVFQDVARDAFARSQLATPLSGREASNRLLELYRRSRSDMQEGGTNTLFLAAGFLRWKRTEGDTRSYRAPLLLIPVNVTRRSAQSEFVLEPHEDELRFNATLLEFLKRDFDLEMPEFQGELPRDESGHDLPRIFEAVRRRVRDVAGFEVVEELALSTFSFAKFLMWKDLVDRTDSLRESALVRHLVDNPTEPFRAQDAPDLPEPIEIDRRVAPRELFTPLPADSSQLAAVLAAQEGHDFVLIGPPGTGKSQTIANMISQCLAVGKTVLFVAEKAAALDVVHRRLAANGLADAVLELHSSKADRKSVLEQLGRSWSRAHTLSEAEWIRLTDEVVLTRDQLDAYVEALHRPNTQGFSVYEAIGQAMSTEPGFTLTFNNKDAHDEQSYTYLRRLAENLTRCRAVVADCPELKLVRVGEWSFSWQAQLLQQTRNLQSSTGDLIAATERLSSALGLVMDAELSPERIEKLAALAAIPHTQEKVAWALSLEPEVLDRDLAHLLSQLDDYRVAASKLSAEYPLDRLKSIPIDSLDADWRQAQTKLWPFSSLKKLSVRKLLQTYTVTGQVDPAVDITLLIQLRELEKEIQCHPLKECPLFEGIRTDSKRLRQWHEQANTLREALERLRPEVQNADAWRAATRQLADRENVDLLELITAFADHHHVWCDAAKRFSEIAGAEPECQPLQTLTVELQHIIDNKVHLSDWTRWVEVRDQAVGSGLGGMVKALEHDPSSGGENAFVAAYATWWLPLAMDAEPVLRGFSHWEHEALIKQFRAADERAMEAAASQVLRRIQHGLPSRDSVARRSELGTLRHQLGLQRPSLPIRSLIAEMPSTFTKLSPCVLMSPLSVAQYLPAGQAAFDVVIFDEASQITTWDAIGAIARGRQAIIVGDPKQLPPTNFFGRNDEPEEEIPDSERDLASILDEVVAAGIPTRQLEWHYRSRDESLIAFSNWHYYGGRLITFPSPATATGAVMLHQINGLYARGQGRTNDDEARAIVTLAVNRMTEWLKQPEAKRQTLGIITFNAEQQSHILNLLDKERQRNPELEWFFADEREEPVIVKNLENIQGDERDVILFSITFGKDHAGKLSMAFGALNSDGGEKRLNVAVSRARQEMHVFASLSADQIDLNRTNALGVKHLKNFLDYAARGAVALPAMDEGALGDVDSPFEAAVKSTLEALGWEVRPQIGVSGFRIDLGVVHPDHAGVYLAGIECDGATYHGSATARDRDKVRQAVLEGLGWMIFRIWSTDWFKQRQPVVERIQALLMEHLEADRAKRASLADDLHEPGASPEQAYLESGPAQDDQEPLYESDGRMTISDETSEEPSTVDAGEWRRAEPMVARVALPRAVDLNVEKLEESNASIEPDKFFDPAYDSILAGLVARVVEKEGPLPLALLTRRVAALHGWQRAGRRISDRVRQSLGQVEVHVEGDVDFVWAQHVHGERVAFRHGANRSVRDISCAEIAWLYDEHSKTLEASNDPVLDLARLAGISRLSADARQYLETCIEWRESTARPY